MDQCTSFTYHARIKGNRFSTFSTDDAVGSLSAIADMLHQTTGHSGPHQRRGLGARGRRPIHCTEWRHHLLRINITRRLSHEETCIAKRMRSHPNHGSSTSDLAAEVSAISCAFGTIFQTATAQVTVTSSCAPGMVPHRQWLLRDEVIRPTRQLARLNALTHDHCRGLMIVLYDCRGHDVFGQ